MTEQIKPETELQTLAKMLSQIHFEIQQTNRLLQILIERTAPIPPLKSPKSIWEKTQPTKP